MKILFYSHYFPPSIGGVETIMVSLASGISQLGNAAGTKDFSVSLVTQTPAGDFDDRTFPFRIWRRPNFFWLAQLIAKCDLVHAAGPALVPILLARLFGKPYVIEHHTYQAVCPNGNFVQRPQNQICPGHFQLGNYGRCATCVQKEFAGGRGLMKLISMFPRYWLSRSATQNIAVSKHVQRRLGLPRCEIIYHGVEIAAANHPSQLTTASKICFCYVGRLVSEKGLALLLQAVAILKAEGHDFSVVIIGDGDERPVLEETIRSRALGDYVSLQGALTGNDLQNALSRVHALVMPSLWEETAGVSAMEQMMRGRLVIASNIAGLQEIVDDAGLHFIPGNAASLAICMRYVIADPSLIASCGEKAAARAIDLFSLQRMIESHAELYKRALAHE